MNDPLIQQPRSDSSQDRSERVHLDETIVAIGSPPTSAPRGVVRMSGADCLAILARIGIDTSSIRKATRVECEIALGEPLGTIPVSALVWPDRRSYTGEPSTELHTLGCLPVLQSIVEHLVAAGARAARPGEFTLRAFMAGRLDLTQAEAVLGVIDAEHRGALDSALRQLAGNLSRPLEQLRAEMLDLLADVEAGLDFVDEDIEFVSDESLIQRLQAGASAVDAVRQTLAARGDTAVQTLVALRGLPNVGKSRLINSLSRTDAAIVADVAGTTRDVVVVDMQHQGHALRLVDTAGIESRSHEISQAAQRQAEQAMRDADIRVWCIDLSQPGLDEAITAYQAIAASSNTNRFDLWVGTKADAMNAEQRIEAEACLDRRCPGVWHITSALSGEGVDCLRSQIADLIAARDRQEVGSVLGTAARCSGSLASASEALSAAISLAIHREGHEYVSSELRLAIEMIGEVTGAVYTDDILDRVFSRFCIGK